MPDRNLGEDPAVSIVVATASYRTIRGYTVVASILDEIAFWRSEERINGMRKQVLKKSGFTFRLVPAPIPER